MLGDYFSLRGRVHAAEGEFTRIGESGVEPKAKQVITLWRGGEKRPLLNVPDPVTRIQELLDQRRDGYGRFPQIITTGKTPAQVAQEIIEKTKTND